MQDRIRAWLWTGVLLASLGALAGCRREEAVPPPTPEQVKAGLDKTAERIRNDPKLTPEQKEAAIRGLYGMAAGIKTQGQGKK